MAVYLNEFVKMINNINEKGGILCNIKGQTRFFKMYIINCTADIPARVKMSGLLLFNAYFGCDWCLARGEYHAGSMRYPIEGKIEPRNSNDTIQHMLTAAQTGRPVMGIKHISPLIFLKYFDIIKSIVPDYMHAILLGVLGQF